VKRRFKATLASGRGRPPHVRRYRHRSGKLVWGLASATVLKDEADGSTSLLMQIVDITERRQAEIELNASEERFRGVFELSTVGTVLLSPEGRFHKVNRAYGEFTGYQPDELLGRAFDTVIHPDEVAEARCRWDAAVKGDLRHYVYERRYRHKSGREVWGLVSVAVLRGPDQAVEGLVVQVQDITDRKQAEAALRESETRFRALIDHSPNKIHIKDLEGRFLVANRASSELFGISEAELIGKTSGQIFPAATAKHFLDHDREVLCREQAVEAEEVFESRRGEHVFLTVKFPIRDAAGKLIGTGSVGTEITARKRIEEALRTSEERLKSAAEAANLGYFVWDHETQRCVTCSEELGRIFGVTTEAYLAAHADLEGSLELVHPDDRARYREAVLDCDARKVPLDIEYRILRKDGEIRHVRERERLLSGAEGGPLRFEGILQDVTEQRVTEEKFRQAQKMEAVGQLTGGLAHDFNNLLAVITGNLELALEDNGSDSGLAQLLQPALRAARRGADLTSRLLAFSRRQSLEPSSVELGELAAGMAELFRRTLGETIEVVFEGAQEPWTVSADRPQMESALLNLALNARDAMPLGGTLTIEIANLSLAADAGERPLDLEPGDCELIEELRRKVLSVADNGSGMEPQVKARAFEPFFTTKPVGRGSGLGLSMVYGFARQSGGQVTIDSEPGAGTKVSLFLPRARALAAPEARGDGDGAPGARGETILVVEDDAEVRELAKRFLISFGYQVLEADSGVTGLAEIEGDRPIDLLFADVVLAGGMSGPDLARAALGRRPGLRVLFMSGYASGGLAEPGASPADHPLLNKPFRRTQLAEAVRRALDQSAPLRQRSERAAAVSSGRAPLLPGARLRSQGLARPRRPGSTTS